ncbi:MAG: diguanylate cyclase [Lachnospiraceae bacterium]|nr:diguanylate cyclase [Lachnospiraceae bacterium]
MKKKIAVMANGWNSENLSNFMMGLTEAMPEEVADFFVFLGYGTYGYPENAKRAESVIYDLPDLTRFDAIIIFGPGLNFKEVIDKIQKNADAAGVPVISIGLKHPGHYYIAADNYFGMKDLVDHVIEKHGVRKMLYIAGSAENDDSNIRLQAIIDSTNQHKVEFNLKDDVFYSDWEAGKALNFIRSYYKSPEEFPDAFICANDHLAMGVSQAVEGFFHYEPQKVKVTGFDKLDSGQVFFPSITTVDQRYDEIGRIAARYLVKLYKGQELPLETTVPCKFVPAESCGCLKGKSSGLHRKKYVRRIQMDNQLRSMKDGRLFTIERLIFETRNYRSMQKNMRDLLYNQPSFEGNTFYMVFSNIMEKIGEKEESLLPRFELEDRYDVIAGKRYNVPVKDETVTRSDLIPGYEPAGPNQIFLVGVLRYEDLICGYLVKGSTAAAIRDDSFHDYQDRINKAFYAYIRNMQLNALNRKLADLMEQDALTHVKNRTAYDKYVRNFNKEIADGERKEFAVGYFDLNNLKTINDKYGHEAGDAYIRNSCKLICDTFKHSPVFRIGGDEFLCIICNDDYKNKDKLLNGMREEMEAREKDPIKFSPAARVSIASGMAVFDKEKDNDVISVVNRADVLMYENKFKMKKGNVR